MNKNKEIYGISIIGSYNGTCFNMSLTETEFKLVQRVSILSIKKASTYDPTIEIKKGHFV